MGTVLVRTIKGLPPGFELKKYAQCANFTVCDWARNLGRRNALRLLAGKVGSGDKFKSAFAAEATRLVNDPIVRAIDGPPVAGATKGQTERAAVREMTVDDWLASSYLSDSLDRLDFNGVNLIAGSLAAAGPSHIWNWPLSRLAKEVGEHSASESAIRASCSVQGHELKRWISNHLDGNAVAIVDLTIPDEQLLRDFKTWLRGIRKSAGAPKYPRKLDEREFRDWIAFQVLPYLDLSHWAFANGCTISQAILADVLFPDDIEIGAVDRVRKVVIPQAHFASSDDVVSRLRAECRSYSVNATGTKA